jgi:hypothetical protein
MKRSQFTDQQIAFILHLGSGAPGFGGAPGRPGMAGQGVAEGGGP